MDLQVAVCAMDRVKVMVVVDICFAYMQVWYPMLRFREEGMSTFSVGPEEGKVYSSKKGYPCQANKSIDSVSTKVSCYWCVCVCLHDGAACCACHQTSEPPDCTHEM